MTAQLGSTHTGSLSTPASSVNLNLNSPHSPKSTASLNGLHKETIDSLEKQIDFHVGETNRLRYALNLHVPSVSRLLTELLSQVFLHVVRSSLQGGDTYFARGTFDFRLVSKRWNEVAVGFPRLWSLWVAGAIKAWPLFNSRSKDGPLTLTWRPHLSASARDIMMAPAIPRRTYGLDFSGTGDQLSYFLGVFDSNPPSNLSSIRLQVNPYDGREPQGCLARLLSLPLPKLSTLNIGNFLPNPSSPIFTTSKLISLKLFLPYQKEGRYTLAQFSEILQQHPTLQELDLNHGAIPLPGVPGTSAPVVLPRLAILRLHGTSGPILGLMDLIGTSSPLHNIVIHFCHATNSTVADITKTMETILVPYYNRQDLDHPREVRSLAISMRGSLLTYDARSHSTPTSNLELQFRLSGGLVLHNLAEETFAFFPSGNIREFSIRELTLTREMVWKMGDLLHLRLYHQHGHVLLLALDALSLGDQGVSAESTEKKLDNLHTCR